MTNNVVSMESYIKSKSFKLEKPISLKLLELNLYILNLKSCIKKMYDCGSIEKSLADDIMRQAQMISDFAAFCTDK